MEISSTQSDRDQFHSMRIENISIQWEQKSVDVSGDAGLFNSVRKEVSFIYEYGD